MACSSVVAGPRASSSMMTLRFPCARTGAAIARATNSRKIARKRVMGSIISPYTSSGNRIVDDDLRSWPAVFLLLRRIDAMRILIDRQTVNRILHGKIAEFAEMIGIILMEHGNCPAIARHVNSTEPRIKFNHIRALGHRQIGDGLVRIEVEDSHQVIRLARKKRAAFFHVEGHAVISATAAHGILCDNGIRGGIDYRE